MEFFEYNDDISEYRKRVSDAAGTLSKEQQLTYAALIIKGDPDGILYLTQPYLMFALECADTYHEQHQHTELQDLIISANTGLRRAAAAYANGEGKNHDFKEYAHWWIRQYLGNNR